MRLSPFIYSLVMAAMCTPVYSTTVLNTLSPDETMDGNYFYDISDSHLNLKGNWCAGSSTKEYNYYGNEWEYFPAAILWTGTSRTNVMDGSGTIMFCKDTDNEGVLEFDSRYGTSAQFTIESGITMDNIEVLVENADVTFKNKFNRYLDLCVRDGGIARLADTFSVSGYMNFAIDGGTIITEKPLVLNSKTWMYYGYQYCDESTFVGQLTLGSGGYINYCTEGSFSPLLIQGNMNVAGKCTVYIENNGGFDYEHFNRLPVGSIFTPELPKPGTILFRTQSVSGSLSSLSLVVPKFKVYEEDMDYGQSYKTYDEVGTLTLKDYKLTAIKGKDGWFDIVFVDKSTPDKEYLPDYITGKVSFKLKGVCELTDNLQVDSDEAVSITGTLKDTPTLYGKGAVIKDGYGTLTLAAYNAYSGGTILNSGTLKATGDDSFGRGDITVNGGTLDLGGKAIYNRIVLAGDVIIKGDAKCSGPVSVKGNATLLDKASYKGTTTIDSGHSLTLGEKASLAGDITMNGGVLNIASSKGLTLAKDTTFTFNGGTVNGQLTISKGSGLIWGSGVFSTAPILKDGVIMFQKTDNLMLLKGDKAQVQFGDNSINILGAGAFVLTDKELTINAGTVTVCAAYSEGSDIDLLPYKGDFNINNGTLKLATGKEPTFGTIRVNGKAAVVNGATHYGDIVVDGTLDKGTAIKLLTYEQKVELNSAGELLGTISGVGNVDIHASIDATAAKLTAANINLYDGTFTNTKGIKLAKGQTLTLAGASLNLGLKGALASAAGTTLVVSSNTHVEGSLTLGGGTLIFNSGSSLEVSGTLTLSKAMEVSGSGVITYNTLKAAKNADVEKLFGKGTILDEAKHTLTFGGARMVACADPETESMSLVAAAEDTEEPETTVPDLVQGPATPTPAMLRPAGDAMVQADWAILDANRAFVNTLQGRRDSGVLLADGQGMAWASAMGGVSRHGSENGHNGADVNLSGAAVGVEHTAGANSMLGLAVGHTWGRIGATGVQNLRQDTAHVALYGQTKLPHGFTAEWSAAYGDTSSKGTFYGSRETWSQRSTALSARVSKAQNLNDTTAVRGFAGVNYDATDAGTLETVHTGSVQRLQGEVGAGITHRADKLMTYAEISLTADIDRHTPSVDFGTFRQGGANPGRTGLNFTLGAAYELNDKWNVNAAYHVETAERNTQHSINVGAGRKF